MIRHLRLTTCICLRKINDHTKENKDPPNTGQIYMHVNSPYVKTRKKQNKIRTTS